MSERSDRQLNADAEILRLIRMGRTDAQIALAAHLTPQTIAGHRRRIIADLYDSLPPCVKLTEEDRAADRRVLSRVLRMAMGIPEETEQPRTAPATGQEGAV